MKGFLYYGIVVVVLLLLAFVGWKYLTSVARYERRKKEIALGMGTAVMVFATFLFSPLTFFCADDISDGVTQAVKSGIVVDGKKLSSVTDEVLAYLPENIRSVYGGDVAELVRDMMSGVEDVQLVLTAESIGLSPAEVDAMTRVIDRKIRMLIRRYLMLVCGLCMMILLSVIIILIHLREPEKTLETELKKEHIFEFQQDVFEDINKEKK